MNLKTPNNSSNTSIVPLIFIVLLIVFIWVTTAFFLYLSIATWENRGQFGDMFGAVNSLFSGFAFAGLIYTIHLQRKELGYQRSELELTRKELTRSASAQEASEKALTKQALALETAGRLNALSSVIEHYEIVIDSAGSASREHLALQSRLVYIEQLETLLKEIQRS
jgi:hypothetical protein